jgi:hypothetical protein
MTDAADSEPAKVTRARLQAESAIKDAVKVPPGWRWWTCECDITTPGLPLELATHSTREMWLQHRERICPASVKIKIVTAGDKYEAFIVITDGAQSYCTILNF